MSGTNELIYVDRPEGGVVPGPDSHAAKLRTKVTYDTIMGYDWDISGDGRLSVYAWRSQARTRVASYEAGHWLAVQRARNLR